MATPAVPARIAGLRFILDVACIFIFVVVGRRNHEESATVSGTLTTAAPFLIALVGAWLGARAWKMPRALSTGAVLWIVTVVVGMFVRRFVFNDGTATSFVLVTALVLGLLLVGTRLPKRIRR